jgi:hypothetical protein
MSKQRVTAKELNKQWGVGAQHAYYHKGSNWYHVLREFPGALFDPYGYIVFRTETEFRDCTYLQIAEHVHVSKGIYTIPGYVRVNTDSEDLIPILTVAEPKAVWTSKISPNQQPSTQPLFRMLEAVDLNEPPETTRVSTTISRIAEIHVWHNQ